MTKKPQAKTKNILTVEALSIANRKTPKGYNRLESVDVSPISGAPTRPMTCGLRGIDDIPVNVCLSDRVALPRPNTDQATADL